MAEKDKFQGLCVLQMMWAGPEPFAQPACSITADRKGMIGGPRMRLVKGDMKPNNLGTGKKRIGLQATGGEAGLPSAARSKFEAIPGLTSWVSQCAGETIAQICQTTPWASACHC